MADSRVLGITVLGDFILSEGVDAIVENLLRIGTTAVAVNPTVTAESDEANGSFQPPIDAGSSPRVFDRSLFGKHSLWVRGGVSYQPRVEFYENSAYSPRRPNDLTEKYGSIIGEFIDRAVTEGLKVYFQVGAAQPSGLRDEDRPLLPDGSLPPNRMADTASLASDAMRSYNRAYVKDLLTEYPNISGFRPDWPEYPCYTLGEVFQDFSGHVRAWAIANAFDFDSIQSQVLKLWQMLNGVNSSLDDSLFHQLTSELSRGFVDSCQGSSEIAQGLSEWLRLKAALSVSTLQHWREAIDDAGRPDVELSANAFMPHFTTLTGFDFQRSSEICNAVSPKLYTMHWSLMIKFWAEPILAANPQLSEAAVVACLVRLMDIADGAGGTRVADYGYPAPDEPHPVPDAPQVRKLELVSTLVGGRCAVTPLVHGYGPLDDFRRRLELVARCKAVSGLWINRYGYLSDEKLAAIAEVCK